jgi:hypothetical protein
VPACPPALRIRRTRARARARTPFGRGAVAARRQRPTVSRSPLTTRAHPSHSSQCASIRRHAVASSSPSR